MRVLLTTALAAILLASVPQRLSATPQSPSGEPLTAKEVRKAEASAKTAADHLRLAMYYETKAKQTQSKLAEAEDSVNYWGSKSWMVGRTKVPNPYSDAKSRAATYRMEYEKETKLAADHRHLAETLQASGGE
jgi:hypothetical protein